MNTQTVVIEKTYDRPVSDVWKAITQVELLQQWYFNLPEFRPEVGFEFSFESQTCETAKIHLCRVTEVVSGQRLSYSWRYQGYEGSSLVTFELEPAGSGTKLRLTHQGLENFPAELREKKNFSEGWTYLLGTALPQTLHLLTQTA